MLLEWILTYKLFLIPLVVGISIQIIKLFIDLMQGKNFIQLADIRTAGGFPSVHSGISASVVTIMGLEYGIDSPYFAISICFAFLFWYDAANIRYQAGQHAQYLNYFYRLLHELKKIGIQEKHLDHLRERLGHTFVEVIGGVVSGVALTFFLSHILLYSLLKI